ncbi:MAG: hypothetical protein WBN90_05660 [Gammaproteobacteria bacterium]
MNKTEDETMSAIPGQAWLVLVLSMCIFFGILGMRGTGAFDFNKRIETTLKDKYGEEEGIHFPLEE